MDDVAVAAEHDNMQLEKLPADVTCPIDACIDQVLIAEQHEPHMTPTSNI